MNAVMSQRRRVEVLVSLANLQIEFGKPAVSGARPGHCGMADGMAGSHERGSGIQRTVAAAVMPLAFRISGPMR